MMARRVFTGQSTAADFTAAGIPTMTGGRRNWAAVNREARADMMSNYAKYFDQHTFEDASLPVLIQAILRINDANGAAAEFVGDLIASRVAGTNKNVEDVFRSTIRGRDPGFDRQVELPHGNLSFEEMVDQENVRVPGFLKGITRLDASICDIKSPFAFSWRYVHFEGTTIRVAKSNFVMNVSVKDIAGGGFGILGGNNNNNIVNNNNNNNNNTDKAMMHLKSNFVPVSLMLLHSHPKRWFLPQVWLFFAQGIFFISSDSEPSIVHPPIIELAQAYKTWVQRLGWVAGSKGMNVLFNKDATIADFAAGGSALIVNKHLYFMFISFYLTVVTEARRAVLANASQGSETWENERWNAVVKKIDGTWVDLMKAFGIVNNNTEPDLYAFKQGSDSRVVDYRLRSCFKSIANTQTLSWAKEVLGGSAVSVGVFNVVIEDPNKKASNQQQGTEDTKGKCFKCNKEGHKAINCPGK